MRVTQQQIMSQMLSDMKKIDSNTSKGFEKGQVFKAVIREVMSDGLLLELKSGELLRANLPQGGVYEAGSQHSFEVLEGGKQMLVRPFSEEAMKSIESTLEELFKGSGEKVTPEKIDAAKALLSFGQPLSKESIQELVKTAKQVDTFKGLIEGNMIKLEDIPPKSTLKQVLVSFYSNEKAGSLDNEVDLHRLMQNASGDKPVNQDGKILLTDPSQEALKGANTKGQVVGADLIIEEGRVKETQIGEKGEAGKSLVNEQAILKEETTIKLLDLLKNVDFQKLAFHKSANLGTSIQNLAMLDKLVFGKDTIGNQIMALIDTLNEAPEKIPQELKTLLKDLEGLGLKDENKLDETLSKIIESLDKGEDKEGQSLNQVKSQMTTIQQSVEYMKDMNENISYFQLPLQIDDEMHSVDFFVKKRNNPNKSEDETTIFISLDTHHLETVQVLVEYKKQTVGVQFRLSDQSVLDKLQAEQAELHDQLSDVTDKIFEVHFRLKDKANTNLDVIAEISSTSSASIDMKV